MRTPDPHIAAVQRVLDMRPAFRCQLDLRNAAEWHTDIADAAYMPTEILEAELRAWVADADMRWLAYTATTETERVGIRDLWGKS